MPLFPRYDDDPRQQLLRRLQRLGDRVPEGATRFHRRRRQLERAIEDRRPRLLGLLRPRGLDELILRVEDLEELAPPLIQLLQQADAVEDEIRQVLERGRQDGDEELAEGLEGSADRWRNRLAQAGLDVDRLVEIDRERVRLAALREEVRNHGAALDLLVLAAEVVRRRERHPERRLEAAPLQGQLPQLRLRLLHEGPQDEWVDLLRQEVEDLVRHDKRDDGEPDELEDLYRELPEWSALLRHRETEVRDFLREMDRKRNDPGADRSVRTALRETGNQLLQDLHSTAREVRERETQRLRGQLDDLQRACGPQSPLQAGFDRLVRPGGGDFDDHERWLVDLQDLRDELKSTVWARNQELRSRLVEQLEGLETRLHGLLDRPLSPRLREAAGAAEAEVRRLRAADDPMAILVSLRRADEVAEEVDRLGRRADDEQTELRRQRESLARRHRELHRHAAELGLALPDLGPAIDLLESGSGDLDLEQVQRRARELEQEVDRLTERFLEACLAATAEDLQAARRLEGLLQHHGSPAVPSGLRLGVPSELLPSDRRILPAEAAAARTRASEVRRVLDAAVATTLEDLETRRDDAARRLPRSQGAGLPPTERQELAHVAELLESSRAGQDGPEERLPELAAAVREAESFLERLEEPARRLESRRKDGRDRLRRFRRQLWQPGLADLSDRVAALLEGLGLPAAAEAMDPGAAAKQLDEAEGLLAALERQGRRLAAADLDRHRRILEDRSPGTGPETAPEAERLLAELGPPGSPALPPADLRNRVARIARRLDPPHPQELP